MDSSKSESLDRDFSASALGLAADNSPLLWLRIPEGRARVRVASGPRLSDEPFHWLSATAEARTDFTTCLRLPKDTAGRAYEVLDAAGESIHSGVLPDVEGGGAGDSIRIGFLSCHQPFDEEGRVTPEARASLKTALETFRETRPDLVLLLGDQIYADAPESLSVFGGDSPLPIGSEYEEADRNAPDGGLARQALIRKAYQRQYRRFAIPEWRQLQAEFLTLPILDDHDLVDNYAAEEGGKLVEDRVAYRGAIQAYGDYQAARVLGPGTRRSRGFQFTRRLRHVGLFVFDLRTQRDPESGRLLSDEQRVDFEDFLFSSRELPNIALGASIPPLHVPTWAGTLAKYFLAPFAGDFADRLSSDAFVADRDWLLTTLRKHQEEHPGQNVVVLSGDIHACGAWRAEWDVDAPPLYQLIASPITHGIPWWTETAARLSMAATRSIEVGNDRLRLKNLDERGTTPTSTPNFGLLTLPAKSEPPFVTLFGTGRNGARRLLDASLSGRSSRESSPSGR